ncbi:hypothetical protein LEP1GSC021_0318 [Leptospira noguchii str. 1993005606]|uniref:Uncharacterized protein n=1 Tax=Leptospira noguchii str. 2007001578 TaxID=1049974 RepID=A0ABN0J6L7_9LEPT|nr:hypothetical protein LEP1GSC035_2570 [Leptospira noguchii str. 2007001578]EPE82450.1 hypothetical protein LEP1GSC021_0318 [Leptospira noguchii str. 1993005606]
MKNILFLLYNSEYYEIIIMYPQKPQRILCDHSLENFNKLQ